MTTLAFSSSTPADAPRFDLGDVVHEINNALAPILLSVEILRRRVSDPDALRHLDLVAGNAWRGASAVRQILALTAPKPIQGGVRGGLNHRAATSGKGRTARTSSRKRPKPTAGG